MVKDRKMDLEYFISCVHVLCSKMNEVACLRLQISFPNWRICYRDDFEAELGWMLSGIEARQDIGAYNPTI